MFNQRVFLDSVSAKTVESDASNSLKYVPGKARSHHLEMMMSKEELEEEQRSVNATQTSGRYLWGSHREKQTRVLAQFIALGLLDSTSKELEEQTCFRFDWVIYIFTI